MDRNNIKPMSSDRSTSKPEKEPIAIVGIGCRFPGGIKDAPSFWQLLKDSGNAVVEIPADRMDTEAYYDPVPGVPGRMATRWGGFLEKIDEFDAAFFGISPHEAERLDPQQRLLLEVAWEALEDAGQAPDQLNGSRTGVFIGMWLNDFEARLFRNPTEVDFYMTTGSGRYTASGRLSFILGLQGPSLSVDTHCSSSLVAVHLACQSIWSGESSLALAGGANVILQPHITIAYSGSMMIAPDGRCKFGDARADGYVRSEGAGVVVLKPLAQARADGDAIYALIRGTAVGNHGRSSGFLATPARQGQEELLRLAYQDAGISPAQVSYVEAHGTGTYAGDPVELEALGRILGEGRRQDQKCAIGSVKTNFGHTEGAAGIAGLIKAALTIKHRLIPANLHFEEPNPSISWSELPIYIPKELVPWPANDEPAYAGVSSFGIAGTNAHVVLSEAPQTNRDTRPADLRPPAWCLLPLSAQTPDALRALAKSYQEFLSKDPTPALQDICYTAAVRRTHHEYRLAIVAQDQESAATSLKHYLKSKDFPGVISNRADPFYRHKAVFIFPGQGSQWAGMCRGLLDREPVFRQAVVHFDQAVQAFAGWSILEQLLLDPGEPHYRMDQIDVIQPVLLAIEIGLAELWRSWGITPIAVIGHSLGEVGAAYVAGALSLADAVRVICLRSQLLKQISGQGSMAVVGLTVNQAQEVIKGYEQTLAIAASNSHRSTVLAGDPAALHEVLESLRRNNVFCRPVNVEVASHCPQVEPLKMDLIRQLNGLQPRTGSIPIYSTAAGWVTDGSNFDAHYWGLNLRNPVIFSSMIEQLLADGFTLFLELSPHPILTTAVEDTIRHLDKEAYTVASLRRNEQEQPSLLAALAMIYTAGYPVDFERLTPEQGQVVHLPAYAWQRKRYWLKTANTQAGWQTAGKPEDPLLGNRLPELAHLPGQYIWDNRVNNRFRRHLHPHLAEKSDILPERIYQMMALSAATELFGEKTHAIRSLSVSRPLVLNGGSERNLQFIVEARQTNGASGPEHADFMLYSRDQDESAWQEHATGQLQIGQVGMDWFYQVDWIEAPKEHKLEDQPEAGAGHWLIFSDQGGVGAALARQLEDLNQSCTLLYQQPVGVPAKQGVVSVDTGQPEGLSQALDKIDAETKARWKGIIYLWNLDISHSDRIGSLAALEEAQRVSCTYIISLVQSLLGTEWDESPKLWLVTSDAQPVSHAITPSGTQASLPPELPLSLTHALTWGLGRTIALEYPELWGGLVDLPQSYTPSSAAGWIFQELSAPDGEDQVAYRDGQRYLPRLTPGLTPELEMKPLSIQPQATYLITGGLGYIGLRLAQWLVDHGAKHIVLTSRTGLPDRDQWEDISAESLTGRRVAAIQAIEASGANIHVARADVADQAQMSALFAQLSRTNPPIRGIIHTAGVFAFQPISQMDTDILDQVLRPKVLGTWLLHALTKDLPLDYFILFSSTTATLGSTGMSSYAAANHLLAKVAHYRSATGHPGLSVDWGLWAGDNQETVEFSQLGLQSGFRLMPAEMAIEALEYLLHTGAVQKIVADIDWNTFKPLYETKRIRPLLASIKVERQSITAGETDRQDNEFLQKLARASKNKRRELLISLVSDHVRAILGLNPSDPIDIRQGFFKLGLDSLMSLQLHNRMEASLNISWPTTVALEYPSIASLVDYIMEEALPALFLEGPGQPAAAEPELKVIEKDRVEVNLSEVSDQELLDLLDGELSMINDLLEGD